MRWSGRAAALKATALALGIVLACMVSTAVLAQEVEPTAEALEEQIRELRLQASYAEAVEVARKLVELRKGDPEAKPFEIADAEGLVETLQHVAGLPDEAKRELALADSLTEVSERCWEEGRNTEGAAAVQRQLEIRRRMLGPKHVDVARSLNLFGRFLCDSGDPVSGESCLREALSLRRELLGSEHPEIAETLTDLGDALWNQSKYDAAEGLFREGLGMRRRLLGDLHVDVTESLSYLGLLFLSTGDHDAAEPFLREALEVDLELLGEDHLDVARDLGNLAGLSYWRARYSEAAELSRRSLTIKRKVLGDLDRRIAQGTGVLAVILAESGDYSGAEPLLREALEIWRALLGDSHPDVATALNNLAALLQLLGKYDEADPLLREALEIDRAFLNDADPLLALDLNNLGVNLSGQGRPADAIPLYREALAVNRRAMDGPHPDTARTLNNLAAAQSELGNIAAAVPLYREALAMNIAVLGEDHPSVAWDMYQLAITLTATGDYAASEVLYRRALAISEQVLGIEHDTVAQIMTSLGSLLRSQGDYRAAEMMCQEALSRLRQVFGDENELTARCLTALGSVRAALGDRASAKALHREALAIRNEVLGEQHPAVAATLAYLGDLLSDEGDHTGAELCFRRAISIQEERFGRTQAVASSLGGLARALLSQGKYEEAETALLEALATHKAIRGAADPHVCQTQMDLAAVSRAEGDLVSAESFASEACRTYDLARLRAGSGLAAATFLDSPYDELAAIRLGLGRGDEAWPAAERGLARLLCDLLVAAEKRGLTERERTVEDSLMGKLTRLQEELAVYQEASRHDTTSEASLHARQVRRALLAAEADWSALEYEIAIKYPLREGQTYALERVQSALPDEAAITGWLDVPVRKNEYEAWCYAIPNRGPVTWARVNLPPSSKDSRSPSDRARSFRDRLASPASPGAVVTRESRELWGERIAPLLGALEGVEKLIVVPSGAMLGVPVEALVDNEGVFVGETYAVSYVPSATLHAWLAERADRNVGSGTLLLGDPPYNPAHLAAMHREEDVLLASAELSPGAETLRSALAGNDDALRALPRLQGTRSEVAAVAAVSEPSSLLLGSEATEQELVRLAESGELGEFGTIHIATHALVDDERPERSALVLSQVDLPDRLEATMAGTRIYDGLVTAKEIVREWDLNADLVTLSACETGLGKEVMGEGYVGFAHAFFQAGARSLLVSLWKVEDTATSLLMRRFYENWLGEYSEERSGRVGEPMTKAEALREAKKWLRGHTDDVGRKPYEHPYFWSAFVLIGNRS